MATKTINYQATPTGKMFHQSEKVVRGLRGCVGSGKTVACINELHRLAVMQWPNAQGVRKTRFGIIRNTTPELRTTTLNTFKQWIPEELCPVTLHPIIMGMLRYPLPDKTTVEAEFLFLALDNDRDVRKLLSLELTGVFINEAREVPFSVVKAARERIGRYPSSIDGYRDEGDYRAPDEPCRRKALVMDTNPPDESHWWYQLAENGYLESTPEEQREKAKEETKRIFDFFACPPPLIKQGDGQYKPNHQEAENINHLPGGFQYYLDMLAGNTEDHINVMVLGNYGSIRDGKPVYPEYNDNIHCKDVEPIPGLPIALAWDFGLTPACVVGQLTSTGQLRVLREMVSRDMSVRQFARDVVKPTLAREFRGFRVAFSLGDPAGDNRGEGEGKSAIGILNDRYVDDDGLMEPLDLGFETLRAPSNDITRRLNAVKTFLVKLVDHGEPGYVLDRECRTLRAGKLGKYKYRQIQVSGTQKYHDKPDKDDYSHPADAEQYLALGFLEGYDVDQFDELPYEEVGEDTRSAVGGY